MVAKPIPPKDNLQTDLNTVLLSINDKIDPSTSQKIQQAMDKLLEQNNKFNREVLVASVDELLIICDSKELHQQEIKKIVVFLESLKDFLSKGVSNLLNYNNHLREEQLNKIKNKIEDIQESRRFRR
ncbi:MAG: hypothetical protein JO131_08515 [Gammaproteobacteria bacterium]|nr:hypothetical protein [Gammaproteobacteria bacterium]